MIARIMNPIKRESSIIHKITYNENKVKEGVAERLIDNTFSPTKDSFHYIESFQDCYNQREVRNLAHEIILSFHSSDNLTAERLGDLAREYMKIMELDNTPYLCYRHSDKEHDHCHILFPNVDLDGNTLKMGNSKKRSLQTCISLEKKNGLYLHADGKKTGLDNTLNELNRNKFYLSNAIKKAMKSFSEKVFFDSFLTQQQREYLTKNKDIETQKIYILLGKVKTEELTSRLIKNGFMGTFYKDQLKEKLDEILKGNPGKREFTRRCKEQGVYCRLLSENGRFFYKYGLQQYNFYCNESSLPGRYRHQNVGGPAELKNHRGNEAQQYYYIKSVVSSCFEDPNIKTFTDFSNAIAHKGIELITHENRGGVYGFSFRVQDEDKIYFKASELDRGYSFKNIIERFPEYLDEQVRNIQGLTPSDNPTWKNYEITQEEKAVFESASRSFSTPYFGGQGGRRHDEFEINKKRKKKKRNIDKSLNR